MENLIQPDSYMPKYIQIQNFVLDKIAGGEFEIGEKIPSECELAKSFDVSRITANAAIKELATRGVVERVRGKGTFVLPQTKEEPDGIPMAFASGIRVNPTGKPEHKEHRLISHGVVEPSLALRRRLGLPQGEQVYKIVRQVDVGGRPGELDYSYIPMSVCGNHELLREQIENSYLHNYLKNWLYRKPKYVRIFINTQMTPDMELSLLGVEKADQLFIWDTFVYDEQGVVALTVTLSIPQKNKPFLTLEL